MTIWEKLAMVLAEAALTRLLQAEHGEAEVENVVKRARERAEAEKRIELSEPPGRPEPKE